MDFMHNGTKIELLPSGKFQTAINGKKVIGPSLDGLKKQIDNAAKSTFTPFKALVESWRDLKEVTVVGVKPPRKNDIRQRHQFVDANGATYSSLILDTPENRNALAEIEVYRKETKRIEEERRAVSEQLYEAVKKATADDYAPAKPKLREESR